MITVRDQYIADLMINGEKININEADLLLIKSIEEAGNYLPSIEVRFILRDVKQFSKMVEGNTLTVGIGRDSNTLRYSNYRILSRNKEYDSYSQITVRLVGISHRVNYTLNSNINKFIGKTSLEVISDISNSYFKFSTNITSKPIDKMNWYQANITDRQMLTKAWLHSKFSNNEIMMVGITRDDELRVRGLKNTISGNNVEKWNFTVTGSDVPGFSKIVISGKPKYTSSSGTADFLSGFPKSRIVHNFDDHQTNLITPRNDISIADTDLIETSNIGSRFNTVSVHNDTMHDEYFNARDYNVCNLIRLSSLRAKVLVDGLYFNIGLLDLAVIKAEDTWVGGPNYDGTQLFIVEKIVWLIKNRKIMSIITLCKDSINKVK